MTRRLHAGARIVASAFLFWAGGPAELCAAVAAPDLDLLRQESEVKRELQDKIQADILDPILGKDRAKVFVDIELEVMAQRRENVRAGLGLAERYREKPGARSAGIQTQFVLPGIPKPKNVANPSSLGGDKPEAAQGQTATQEKAESEEVYGIKTIVKRMLVTVIHDDTVSSSLLELVRSRIVDALAKFKLQKDQILFRPTRFNSLSWLDDMKDPRVYIPLLFATLFSLLLLYLFFPVRKFLQAYVEAIREKPAAEVNVESEIEAPQPEEGGDLGGPDKRELDIMLGRKPPEPPPPPDEEDDMKKLEPFSYINEENLKRLANLFMLRREEPWLIAVVLNYLKPEYARQVLTQLPVELQAKVAME
ncbi:MAG: hypothetical protein HY554_09520, partial [Elusimicrobia bacterium]|nr:hypothetical protein [Elusimicrobiota bacterium]